MKAIKKFKFNIKELPLKERKVFEKLVSSCELITPLYLAQKNEKYPGANFYPHNVAKEEVEKEARRNPLILNPYTFVERNKKGKLTAIPYHIKFKKELKPIADLIKEAAELAEDKNFARYLESRAKALLDGNYEKSDILLLKNKPFKICFIIGPVEWYLDKLFAKKYAYQAWVGIIDEEKTKKAKNLVDIVLSSQRKILPGSKKINVSKINTRIDKTSILSGLIAELSISSMSLPREAKVIKKYGSKLTIFEPVLKSRFQKDYLLIFQKIFNKEFQKAYSAELLYDGALRYTLLNEVSSSLIYYKDAEKRLGNLFYIFYEFLANILSIKSCGTLFLKGIISQKELEASLIFYICRNFSLGQLSIKKPGISFHYQKRAAIAFNFFLKEGAIKELKNKKGIYLSNFTKFFICIDELSRLVEYYLALGSYKEAKNFVKKYSSFDVFRKLADSQIKKK